jgi:hypothetical protein
VELKEFIVREISASRAKDYSNPYRKMVFENEEEMNEVLGSLNNNSFIMQQQKELESFKTRVKNLKKKFNLATVEAN